MILDTTFQLDPTSNKIELEISVLATSGLVWPHLTYSLPETGFSLRFTHILSHLDVCEHQMIMRTEYEASKVKKWERSVEGGAHSKLTTSK